MKIGLVDVDGHNYPNIMKSVAAMRKDVIEWLERERDKTDAHLKHAEQKSGVKDEEIRNLSRKIRCIDYARLCVTLS